MVQLVATTRFSYGGQTRQPGDAFLASAGDARILRLLGKVHEANDHEPTHPMTKDVPVETVSAPRRRRRYRRRDLTAE